MCACFLQNPVNTLQWLEADVHLLGPLTSMVIDTKDFCQPVLRAKLMLSLAVVFNALAWACILTRTPHSSNPFSLFDFVQLFRLQLAGLIVLECVIYFLVVSCVRRLVALYEQRRLHPTAA